MPDSLLKCKPKSRAYFSIHVLRQSAANPYKQIHSQLPVHLTSLNPFKGVKIRGNRSLQASLECATDEPTTRSRPSPAPSLTKNPRRMTGQGYLFQIKHQPSVSLPAEKLISSKRTEKGSPPTVTGVLGRAHLTSNSNSRRK